MHWKIKIDKNARKYLLKLLPSLLHPSYDFKEGHGGR